jgi:hypothetical protein
MPWFSLKRLFAFVALAASTCWFWTIIFLSADSWQYSLATKVALFLGFGTSFGGVVGVLFNCALKAAAIALVFMASMLVLMSLFPGVR